MTEQAGQNSEVLPDLPAVPAVVDPQSDSAPVVPQQEAEAAGVMEATAAQGDATAPAPDETQPTPPEMVAASPQPVADAVPAESVDRVKAALRPKAVPKSRKAAAVAAAPSAPEVPKSENMNWYILKVQSNREESIREGLLRRVSIQGLDRYFGEVIVPTEKVTEFKAGKKRVIKRKLYPGYIVVHMEINEDTWFLVRETPGIGDFTGASGVPSTMLPHEVERIIAKQEEKSEKAPDLKIPFAKGDRVKVIEGNFENFEGEVDAIDKTNGRVTVMITIFNRTTPVEFEYWQVESV